MDKLSNPTQEEWFEIWLKQLVRLGYVGGYSKNPPAYTIADAVTYDRRIEKLVYKGTKREHIQVTHKKETIEKACTYTPDFHIRWNEKALGIFVNILNDCVSNGIPFHDTYFTCNSDLVTIADVKAPAGYGGGNRSDGTFAVKSKWLLQKHGIKVHKIMLYPIKKVKVTTPYLWLETFTPSRYTFTDKLTKERTIRNWSPKAALQFINLRKNQGLVASH